MDLQERSYLTSGFRRKLPVDCMRAELLQYTLGVVL